MLTHAAGWTLPVMLRAECGLQLAGKHALTTLWRPCCRQVSGGGKAKYEPKRHALIWKFKKFPGESEASLMASVDLIATTKEKRSWAKPPIQLQFHVRASRDWSLRFKLDLRACGISCPLVRLIIACTRRAWRGSGIKEDPMHAL